MRIHRCTFWSPQTTDAGSWLGTFAESADELSPRDIPGESIPAMLRRRTSVLSRMGIHVAMLADEQNSAEFFVFASQHGETRRSAKLIDDIVAGRDVSPTEFSLSVHNTTAGLFSIIRQSRAPTVSVAAGRETFAAAWLETESWLAAHPHAAALLVNHDDCLPEEYVTRADEPRRPFALALLLRSDEAEVDEPAPAVRLRREDGCNGNELPMGPAFSGWVQTGYDGDLRVCANGCTFVWSRLPAT